MRLLPALFMTAALLITACAKDPASESGGSSSRPASATHVRVGSQPRSVVLDSATNTVYVAADGSDSNAVNGVVVAVNGANGSILGSIPVGGGPQKGIDLNSATGKLYVGNQTDGTVSVIKTSTRTVTSTISGWGQPVGVAANSVTNLIYVTDYYSDLVRIIDGSTDTLQTSVTTSTGPWAVAVDTKLNRIYVGCSNALDIFDGSTRQKLTSLSTPLPSAYGLVVNSSTGKIYVFGGRTVKSIDPTSYQVSTLADFGSSGVAMAVDFTNNKAFASAQFSKAILQADLTTGSVTTLYQTTDSSIGSLGALAVNSTTGEVYVVTANSAYGDLGGLGIIPY